MAVRENAEKIYGNLAELGVKRLLVLAFIGIFTFGAIGAAAYMLSRPEQETLYANLERDDVTQIGMALQASGVPFDVSADGKAISVGVGATARARMLLAEKGLPRGSGAGYELFDEMGSLGLTSFMQNVTKIRALEGEIARSIQSMQGVKAARVHLVLPEKATFRRENQKPTASVLIRAEGVQTNSVAQAIRYLVAAAVPGLTVESVTVLDTEGQLLAAGEDGQSASTGRKAVLEKDLSNRTESAIRRALAPYLGVSNFEVSVSTAVNMDNQRVSETTYDPETRVERSFRVVRQSETSQNASLENPTTVEQNLPEEAVSSQGGERSSEENERREELTNYEISSRTVETIFDDYRIQRMSIAVLVNRDRLIDELSRRAEGQKGDAIVDGQEVNLQEKVAELEEIIVTAAGVDIERGDKVSVSAVNFLLAGDQLAAIPERTWQDVLIRNMGSVVNAGAILIVTLMIIWFGLRPAVAFLIPKSEETVDGLPAGANSDGSSAIYDGDVVGENGELPDYSKGEGGRGGDDEFDTTIINRNNLRKLERAVEMDDMQAAIILKQWMYNQERAV
ncbi:flagellar basal-body MS-ring/collar protein FliF [Pseudovibrio sp. Tun.PSC04-5.I4]|uniref:flagellar basal-body MS-ring/collar protein FliF n=1 Tax=Pseudovibrio sp. Tun.PSC04-5.I4 TaxID=1798213 RepID=UPI0008826632|nr:flagellar basal-body MS-ring/collar protein FliF [Pseudovibrio sp. Tun.PSC04-5.I4]SDQ92744.1 flagellar M-ring protein FliF [Pseudovibrio sp. Tun.PSC04-5.I4]